LILSYNVRLYRYALLAAAAERPIGQTHARESMLNNRLKIDQA